MRGSEKQIKWAEDIKRGLLRMCEAAEEQDQQGAAQWHALAEKIAAVDKSWELIDACGSIRFVGTPLEIFNKVMHSVSARDYLRNL